MSRLSLRVRLILAVGLVALLALALADVVVFTSLRSYLYGQMDATLQVAQQSVEAAASPPPAPDPPGTAAPPQGDQQPTGADFCAIGRESAPGMFIEVLTAVGGVVNGDECPAFAPGHKAYSPKLTSLVASQAAGPGRQETAPHFTVASTAGGPSFRVDAAQLPRWGSPRGGGADVRHRQHAGSPASPRALGHRGRAGGRSPGRAVAGPDRSAPVARRGPDGGGDHGR